MDMDHTNHTNHTTVEETEEALRRLATISDTSGDAIIVKSLDNVILSWSRGAERTYGYRADEIVGCSINRLVPPERAGEADRIIARVARGERVEALETVRVAKDGRRVEVCLWVSPIADETGRITGALTIVQDITARREAERLVRELEAQARERALILETANRVALDILASRSGVEALRHIAEAARDLSGARYAALGVAHPDGRGFSGLVAAGLSPQEQAVFEESLPGPPAEAAGVLNLLLERAEPLRLQVPHENGAGATETFLGVPIRRGATPLGALYLTNKRDGQAFSPSDEAAVQALGAHAAVAIHHLRVMEREQALVAGLIAAQEEERHAVAYDLHDGLTQHVMAAHIHLQAFESAHESGRPDKAARELAATSRYLKQAVVESRRVISGLRPLALDDLGLCGALEQLLNEEKERAGWTRATWICNIGARRFDRTLETGVYRIAQEALTNARKYAATERVKVLLECRSDEDSGPAVAPRLVLQVRDWGCGFDLEEQSRRAASGDRVGLHGMAERARLLGGAFELRSAPGDGTMVTVTFPLTNNAEGARDER